MSEDKSLDAQQLIDSVSFELDTDLRLHPQRLELGKTELLTDALTLPFTDIEKRLAQYIVGVTKAEADALRRSMKDYLARLNSNPLIPLHFRLKVLNRFERELELFDAEMTAAVLNAHKIGVELVQKAARTQPSYYRIVVDMAANALGLAVQMLRHGYENYQMPAVIASRQVFDLSRLGLGVLPVLPQEEAVSERDRLCRAIANHELLRKLDFFGKSHNEQQMIWQELEHHVSVLHPRYVRKGEAPPKLAGDTFMVTNTMRPNDAPEVVSSLPSNFIADSIIMPMDDFVDRLVTAINRVETVLRSPDLQQHDLHTEESLHATITGGNAILDALHITKRAIDRQDYSGRRVLLEWAADKAIVESHTALVMSEYEYAPSERENPEAWSVTNIGKGGLGMERVSYTKPEHGVGAMVGLSWIPHKGEPMLGFVRWFKELKPGEQRMGVKFFGGKYHLYKATIIGGSSDEMMKNRSWPLLLKPGKVPLTAVFPDKRVYKNMAFVVSDEGKSAHFKIVEVVKTGPNFAICKVAQAEELKTESLDFSK